MGQLGGMDLASLSKLYAVEGPFVTVYLDTTSAVEDAAARLDLRRKNVLTTLEERGVDRATREAVAGRLQDHTQGNTRVVVAAHGTVHLATWLPEPPARDIVEVGPLPHLLPLVDSLSLRVPHVVVLADREGGDVLAYTTSADPVETATHDSGAWPVHQTGVGGWSSKRYDNTVRNSWEESAREVATLVDNVAKDIGAKLVIGSGDTRALSLLTEHLPEHLREDFVTIDGGGRHVDGGDDVIAEQVITTLADYVARDTLRTLERFAQERGRGEQACEGVRDTIAALRMAQVGTLLLTDAFDAGRPVWFGPEAVQLGLTKADLVDMGVEHPQEGQLADVLLRAAYGTGAEVRILAADAEQSPAEGVGALLRYSADSATTS